MNTTTGITIVALGIAVVIAGAAYVAMSKEDRAMKDTEVNEVSGMDNTDAMKEDEINDMKDDDTMKKPGAYEAYAPEKLARAETGDVVLFFHASWCPSCRGLNADIEQNLGAIPSGMNILKLDYDTETDLKRKYGVTYQHTLVQVDSAGTMIKKWSGSPSLDRLVSEIN